MAAISALESARDVADTSISSGIASKNERFTRDMGAVFDQAAINRDFVRQFNHARPEDWKP
jgi:hypothetical protein